MLSNILWEIQASGYAPIIIGIALSLLFSFFPLSVDFVIVPIVEIVKSIFHVRDMFIHDQTNSRPSGLVIIPSLLRNDSDYDAMIGAMHSCATNEYPGDLIIIASIDGKNENPFLFQKIVSWVNDQNYSSNIHLHVAYNEVRRGKAIAIEAGSEYMQRLVKEGHYALFPKVYFSVDADTTFSKHALERLVARLTTPHPITGNLRKTVAGNIRVHPDELWKGWRSFFTIRGQLFSNVARQFISYGIHRFNMNIIPFIGLPGLLYVTWSDILLTAPYYAGFTKTVSIWDWVKWMFGAKPPLFSEYKGLPLPEGLCGSTDDTTTALIVSVSTWKNGKLTFDAPRTPLHAFGRLLMGWFVERSCDFEQKAKGFTFVPSTIKSMFFQRVRWNSCRVEAYGRFFGPSFFHWEATAPFLLQLFLILWYVFSAISLYLFYMLIPFLAFGKMGIFYMLFATYLGSLLISTVHSTIAMCIESDSPRSWITMLSIPTGFLFSLMFGFGATAYGIIRDIFGSGMNCKFVPQETLIKGRSQRIAIWFRVKRFIYLCYRSVRKGDIPFGLFWFSWFEKPEYGIENGYHGWTSGKKNSQYILK